MSSWTRCRGSAGRTPVRGKPCARGWQQRRAAAAAATGRARRSRYWRVRRRRGRRSSERPLVRSDCNRLLALPVLLLPLALHLRDLLSCPLRLSTTILPSYMLNCMQKQGSASVACTGIGLQRQSWICCGCVQRWRQLWKVQDRNGRRKRYGIVKMQCCLFSGTCRQGWMAVRCGRWGSGCSPPAPIWQSSAGGLANSPLSACIDTARELKLLLVQPASSATCLKLAQVRTAKITSCRSLTFTFGNRAITHCPLLSVRSARSPRSLPNCPCSLKSSLLYTS